jgi:hypothetical protein
VKWSSEAVGLTVGRDLAAISLEGGTTGFGNVRLGARLSSLMPEERASISRLTRASMSSIPRWQAPIATDTRHTPADATRAR